MVKLKHFLKVIPKNTLIEITSQRKNSPLIIETNIVEYVKFQNQYIVEEVVPCQSILKIQVRERRKR